MFLFCLQDVTDFEWEFWLSAIGYLMPAMLLHAIGGMIFSRFLSQVRNGFCFATPLTMAFSWTIVRTIIGKNPICSNSALRKNNITVLHSGVRSKALFQASECVCHPQSEDERRFQIPSAYSVNGTLLNCHVFRDGRPFKFASF